MKNSPRTKTVTWENPEISARDSNAVSGIDYLLSIKEGKVAQPPIARLIGYKISEIGHGRTIFTLKPEECHYNPFSTVHGGVISTLLDTAMTAAVLSTLTAGFTCLTMEMKVNFIQPVTAKTDRVFCEANVIHAGKRIATAEGKMIDSESNLYAHGVNTCMIIPAQRHGK